MIYKYLKILLKKKRRKRKKRRKKLNPSASKTEINKKILKILAKQLEADEEDVSMTFAKSNKSSKQQSEKEDGSDEEEDEDKTLTTMINEKDEDEDSQPDILGPNKSTLS